MYVEYASISQHQTGGLKMGKSKIKKIIGFICMLVMFIGLLPQNQTMAAAKKNVTFTIKKDQGTAYLPKELTDDIASYFGFEFGDNEVTVFDKNTTFAIDYKNSKYKKDDISLELWGIDVTKNSKGKYVVNFVTFSDTEFMYLMDKPFQLSPKNLGMDVMCDPILFNGGFTSYDNIKNWDKNGTSYPQDLYFFKAYYGGQGAWTGGFFAPKGSNAIAYIDKEYTYIGQPVTSSYDNGAWQAHVDTKKKDQSFRLGIKAEGKITYHYGVGCITKNGKIVKSNKYIKVDKNGKVTVKKGTPAGEYYILINAAATSKYSSRTCWFSIYVN